MTYILGVTPAICWNPSATLLKDGKVVAAAEEERFNRIKHSPMVFPHRAVEWCLKSQNITMNEVESVAVGFASPSQALRRQLGFLLTHPTHPVFARTAYLYYKGQKKDEKFQQEHSSKVHYYKHHLSHAGSAFHVSGFDKANILTIDGMGETESTFMGVGEGNSITQLRNYQWPDSLGNLYAAFTSYLGFIPHSHEWKVMGLASYGRPIYDLAGILDFKQNGYTTNSWYSNWCQAKALLNHSLGREKIKAGTFLRDKYGPSRTREEPITQRHKDIAASIQQGYEVALIKLAEELYDQTGIKNVTLAGGNALNCVANGILQNQDFVKELFVQPVANDAGTSWGAAAMETARLGTKCETMTNVYFGPEFSNDQILAALKKDSPYSYEYVDDIEGEVAELLGKFHLVGWFQGKMEMGPRALGNRSILANSTKLEMKEKVNVCVKHREPWRPFAPSMLGKSLKEYVENPHSSPYMILNFKVHQEKIGEIPAVVHVDGTARVQTVEKSTNARYYKMIAEFEKVSGVPVVMNTSFNDNEEPIVCTPVDAINTFKKTGLDYLAIGNYLVTKNKK